MKELTTIQKAQRYDEILARAKGTNIPYYKEDVMSKVKEFVNYLIPELKESGNNDERMWKLIKKYAHSNISDMVLNADHITREQLESWLEKICEQNPVIEGTFVNADEVRDDFMQEVYRVLDADPTNDRANQIIDAFDHLPTVTIQKPCDNVKPKFHEGEWVQIDRGHIIKILEVEEEIPCYKILNYYGSESIRKISDIDSIAHLWTIKDAKDGDVLFTSSTASHETFIFKNIDERGNVECYFAYDSEDGFREGKHHFIGRAKNCKPATKEQYDALMKAMSDAEYTFDFNKKELKKIEQKSEDKIEPKFTKGDWIINYSNGTLAHINDLKKDIYGTLRYYIEFSNGIKSDPMPCFIDREYSLWTIQDAKDGDVLACENGWTCIFKKLVNDETFSSYCFMDNTKWFCETGSECHTLKEEFVKAYNGKIYPATKEQHDLLFTKMKEAGYEWDSEKRELKKINQKKTPIDGEFPYNNPSDTLEGEIENIWKKLSIEGKFSATKEGFHEVITHFVNYIKEQDNSKLIEQKPLQWNISDYRTWQYIVADVLTKKDGIGQYLDDGFCKNIAKYMQEEWSKKLCLIKHTSWSEEDESMLTRCIGILGKCYMGELPTKVEEELNWLKYLNNRVQLQPKQEWSKEDEDTIKFLISHFCVSHYNRSFQFTTDKLITHDELLEKIRNLRPHWKPNDNQMDALDYYANSICTYSDRQDDLRSLFNDLKKLTK